jgi:hypothetical protein
MARRNNNKSGSQWFFLDESSSEPKLLEGLSDERKTRTPPDSAARKNASNNKNNKKKRRRLEASPGLVQMFCQEELSSGESESSLSFRKNIAFAKKRKRKSALRKQKGNDSLLDLNVNNDNYNSNDDSSYNEEDAGNNDVARLSTPQKGNLSKKISSKKAASLPVSHRTTTKNGKQKSVPTNMKDQARRNHNRQHVSSLQRDTSDDDDDNSVSIEQQSDASTSLGTELSDSEDDITTYSRTLYEPLFVEDGTGKKPIHGLNLKFACSLLQQQAEAATSKVCASLSRKGFKQESKRLQVRSDKHSKKVIGKVRQLLRSTKLPKAYTRAEDPCVEPMDRVNREREKDIERTENVLEKLAQQRQRLEEELKKETRRYEQLVVEHDNVHADANDDEHAHSLLSQLKGETSSSTGRHPKDGRQKAVPLKLRSAPKGTMSRLILKMTKEHQQQQQEHELAPVSATSATTKNVHTDDLS